MSFTPGRGAIKWLLVGWVTAIKFKLSIWTRCMCPNRKTKKRYFLAACFTSDEYYTTFRKKPTISMESVQISIKFSVNVEKLDIFCSWWRLMKCLRVSKGYVAASLLFLDNGQTMEYWWNETFK